MADDIYTGDLIQGKTRTIGHKQIRTNPTEWIMVQNAHEPLVSRELFEQVQTIRRQVADRHNRASKIPYTENILRGRVFCGCCGRTLHRNRGDGVYYYRCISNDRMGKGTCNGNVRYLREAVLFETIINIIQQEAEVVMGNDLRLKQENRKIAAQQAKTAQEITNLRRETERNRALLAGLYENFITGILTRTEYLELKKGYSSKINAAVEQVQRLQEQQKILEHQSQNYTCLADRLASVGKDTALTFQLVSELIERVIVNGPKDVTIRFRFEISFEQLMGVLTDG